MDAKTYLEKGAELFLPHTSVDMVIMGYQDHQLKVLLQQMATKWTLPGGGVGKEESVTDAATRVLYERVGLSNQFLKLFTVFGNGDRSFRDEFEQIFKAVDMAWNPDLWINNRHITICFYALVDIQKTEPTGGNLDLPVAWHPMTALPDMWFDHSAITLAGLEQVRKDVSSEYVSHNLLPEEFSMPELHRLHETILAKKLERSRFQKKMLALDLFERLPKMKEDAPRRKPFLYRIKNKDKSR